MKVAIYGLGYVGTVSSVCLADRGHHVLGVDVNEQKVTAVREGRSPIVEAGVEELLSRGLAAGRIRATTDAEEAARTCDVSIICVGTPSGPGGGTDLRFVEAVAATIARARAGMTEHHTVAIRSTVPPGTTAAVAAILAEHAPDAVFGTAANPEFLREGSAVADFTSPPFTVIGTDDDRAYDSLAEVYAGLSAPLRRTSVGVAELIKYACNSFHGMKVAFANEVGTLARRAGVDGQELMGLFVEDDVLNVSGAYLRPGMAYGGSCLPKDLRGAVHQMRHGDLEAPLLEAVSVSNDAHLRRVLDLVLRSQPTTVTLVGLAFKSGTDDVRESPAVRIAETLIGRGVALRIFDPNVHYASLVGANKAYLDTELPHITALLRESLVDALDGAGAVLVCQRVEGLGAALAALPEGCSVIDTVGLPADEREGAFSYDGICW